MTENCTSKKEKKTFAKVVIYLVHQLPVMVWFMVFNATFNNISAIAWRLVRMVVGFTITCAISVYHH
jgi:hypothetical protein